MPNGWIGKKRGKGGVGANHALKGPSDNRLVYSIYKHMPQPITKPRAEQVKDDTCVLCGYYSYRTKGAVVNGYCQGDVACRRRQAENRQMGLDVSEIVEGP